MAIISISKRKEIKGNAHQFFTTQEIKSFEQMQIILLSCVWSPIVFNGGMRHSANFKEANYLGLDFDSGWSLLDGEKWVTDLGLTAIIGTSKSHQKEKVSPDGTVQAACDRFRIVTPFNRPITKAREYKAVMSEIFKDIPCDPACKGAAQFFYPCTRIVGSFQGQPYPVPDVPDKILQYTGDTKEEMADIRAGMLPVWMLTALRGAGVPPGHRNATLYRIAATLSDAGYTYAEILAMVEGSPFTSLGRQEIEQTVRNGCTSTET